jgi:hypothetical protein
LTAFIDAVIGFIGYLASTLPGCDFRLLFVPRATDRVAGSREPQVVRRGVLSNDVPDRGLW